MAVLGFASGLPFALTAFTLRTWFSFDHLALGITGLTANISLAYILKFLWAPVFDERRAPFAWLGRRRGWLLPVQLALALAIAGLGLSDPAARVGVTLALGALVAFLSASQDVLIDAWRIESFDATEQGAALACYVWGYRIALLLSGAGVIALSATTGWHEAYLLMSLCILIGPVATLLAGEPPPPGPSPKLSFAARVLAPARDFLRRQGAWLVLAYVVLFRLGEALGGVMLAPYYHYLGYNRAAIAIANGPYSLAATLAGAAFGGYLVAKLGTRRALLCTGLIQTVSLLLYPVLGLFPGHPALLVVIAMTEAFVETFAYAAFLSYLSGLCSKEYTAAQYALLSSLSPLALHTVGGLSGYMAAAMGFIPFYMFAALAAVPAMVVMVIILRKEESSAF